MTDPTALADPADPTQPPALWRPDAARIARAPITRFQAFVESRHGLRFADYEAMWRWSVDELECFWQDVADFFALRLHTPARRVLDARRMPGAHWFEGATLNFAEHLLARAQEPDADRVPALVFRNEAGARRTVTWHALANETGALIATLAGLGVTAGDRVVAYSPNIPQTVTAVLATTALGAVWSSCAPDLGATSVLDRFRQIDPKVLIAVDGYRYGGKPFDRRAIVRELVAQLPTLEAVVFIDYLDPGAVLDPGRDDVRVIAWHDAVGTPRPPVFTPVAFEHPVWIVYSSGTTGNPKPIVHGHGGALLENVKSSALHLDLTREDRMMWFSSTSWIMWNFWIGGLGLGMTLLHYDGNPGHPDLNTLWRFAAEERATFYGTSPAFIGQCMKAGVEPGRRFDLSSLRTVGSTGSPLTDEAYRWIYSHVGADLLLASISGGTDPGAAFITASPTLPVYAGEMQCRGLGCAVESYDDEGRPGTGRVGELVCRAPMPSMPLRFWGDDDGARYHASYFETWPGVWRHGDWLELIRRPESITSRVYGRSDSTINRHGIRMGTSELYRVIEAFDEVLDSLVIDLEYLGRPSFMAMFIVQSRGRPASGPLPVDPLAPDGERAARGETGVDPALRQRLVHAIRTQLSARHVPDEVYAIPEIPRTLTGKKLEIPVKRILLGHPLEKAVNRDAMANPKVIDWFVAFARARGA
ncbi:MAG: acetoacetate--CoA ligase [Lautropia sp.]